MGAPSRAKAGSANAAVFACAGLRRAQNVAPLEQNRNRLRLNRCGCSVAFFSVGADDVRRQAKFLESHKYKR